MKLNLAIKLNNTDALNSRVFPYNFNAEVKLARQIKAQLYLFAYTYNRFSLTTNTRGLRYIIQRTERAGKPRNGK